LCVRASESSVFLNLGISSKKQTLLSISGCSRRRSRRRLLLLLRHGPGDVPVRRRGSVSCAASTSKNADADSARDRRLTNFADAALSPAPPFLEAGPHRIRRSSDPLVLESLGADPLDRAGCLPGTFAHFVFRVEFFRGTACRRGGSRRSSGHCLCCPGTRERFCQTQSEIFLQLEDLVSAVRRVGGFVEPGLQRRNGVDVPDRSGAGTRRREEHSTFEVGRWGLVSDEVEKGDHGEGDLKLSLRLGGGKTEKRVRVGWSRSKERRARWLNEQKNSSMRVSFSSFPRVVARCFSLFLVPWRSLLRRCGSRAQASCRAKSIERRETTRLIRLRTRRGAEVFLSFLVMTQQFAFFL